jgi:hypothetical protein
VAKAALALQCESCFEMKTTELADAVSSLGRVADAAVSSDLAVVGKIGMWRHQRAQQHWFGMCCHAYQRRPQRRRHAFCQGWCAAAPRSVSLKSGARARSSTCTYALRPLASGQGSPSRQSNPVLLSDESVEIYI